MPLLHRCGQPRCPERIAFGRYCEAHQKRSEANEVIRTERRLRSEPWRAIYNTKEWRWCKKFVRERDGHKCAECGEPEGIQVHHRAPVATLWLRAEDDWETFVLMATNPEICVTLCPSCHRDADLKLKTEQDPYRAQARKIRRARPRRRRRR